MIRPVPETLELTDHKVQVYQNLDNGQWSVKHRDHPVFHVRACALRRVIFKVSGPGRLRVIASKQRAVHAYAEGIWEAVPTLLPDVSASYNPYNGVPAFYLVDSGAPVYTARAAVFTAQARMLLHL